MSGDPERPGRDPDDLRDDDIPEGVDDWLRPFFRESTLWPVLVAAAGIGATCLGALLLMALRARNLFALAALLGLAWMSVDTVWRDRQKGRIGLASRAILGLWVLAAVAAVAAVRLGLF